MTANEPGVLYEGEGNTRGRHCERSFLMRETELRQILGAGETEGREQFHADPSLVPGPVVHQRCETCLLIHRLPVGHLPNPTKDIPAYYTCEKTDANHCTQQSRRWSQDYLPVGRLDIRNREICHITSTRPPLTLVGNRLRARIPTSWRSTWRPITVPTDPRRRRRAPPPPSPTQRARRSVRLTS